MRSWQAYGLLCLVALVALGIFVYLYQGVVEEKQAELKLDIAKACLTIFVAASAGTIVKGLVELARDERKEKARQRIFKQHVLLDLKAVYNATETSRLLIDAHRSAKTYGEEIRRMISSRVRLSNVKRALESGTVDFGTSTDGLQGCITCMLAYQSVLGEEYRQNYLQVSRKQRVDEVRYKAIAESMLNQRVGDDPWSDETWKSEAWQSIASKKNFPALHDLLSHGLGYTEYFRQPLDAASNELRSQVKGDNSQPIDRYSAVKDESACQKAVRELLGRGGKAES